MSIPKNLIQIYGAERVGKTTFAKNKLNEFENYKYIHFGIPKPNETDSLSNYNLTTNGQLIIGNDQLNFICDRGPLEANIFRPIKLSDIRNLLNVYLEFFDDITFYVLEKPFQNIKLAHKTEILLRELNEVIMTISCYYQKFL